MNIDFSSHFVLFLRFLKIFIYVSLCAGAHGVQKRTPDPWSWSCTHLWAVQHGSWELTRIFVGQGGL